MIDPETERSGTYIMKEMGPTIGEVILEKAVRLARFAAERGTTNQWVEHPMFGIGVDTDKWALAYQKELGELKQLLTPGADQVAAPPDDHKLKAMLSDVIDKNAFKPVVTEFFNVREGCSHYSGIKEDPTESQCLHRWNSSPGSWCSMDFCPLLRELAQDEGIGWDQF